MGGGSKGSSTTTTTQKADPWAGVQPFLVGGGGTPIYQNEQVANPNYFPGAKGQSQFTNQRTRIGTEGGKTGIFPEAEALYNQGLEYYPGQTVTPFSQETEQGLDMRSQLAQQGTPGVDAAINAASGVAGGAYSENPYQEADRTFGGEQDFMRAYGNDIFNNVNDRFNSAGRTGSGRHSFAAAGALGDASQRVYQQEQDRNANLYNSAQSRRFGDDQGAKARGLQNQGQQLQAAALAPALDQARYFGADQLSQVGAARENLENEYMRDAQARHDFGQNAPWENLNRYSSILSSQQLPVSSSGSQTVPTNRSPIGSALGGAALGAGLGLGPLGVGVGALGGLFG